jgi:hypothetical protein
VIEVYRFNIYCLHCEGHPVELEGDPANPVGEAFADDLTAMFRFSQEAIKKIMGILDEFGEISGLKINWEKTHIMIAGKDWEGCERI